MAGFPPKKGEALSFTIPGLVSVADTDNFQVNPTLAAGDVKVFKDGVAAGNIGTLPTAIDAGTELNITLSPAEMTVTYVLVSFKDVAGDEWCSVGITIFTDTQQIGDVALSSEIAALNDVSAADVWAHTPRTPTTSAASVAAALAGSDISILRGDNIVVSFEGLGDISDRDKLWFTMKRDREDADSESIIQIEETAGLDYLNGAAGTAGDGSIVVDDAVAGDVTITLKPAASALLVPREHKYDVQVLMTTGATVHTLTQGDAAVDPDVGRVIA